MFCKLWKILSIIFVLSTNIHFFINAPALIPNSAIKDPLKASGSNFPCYRVDLFTPATHTAIVVGDN
jgi:hypothetical protein